MFVIILIFKYAKLLLDQYPKVKSAINNNGRDKFLENFSNMIIRKETKTKNFIRIKSKEIKEIDRRISPESALLEN